IVAGFDPAPAVAAGVAGVGDYEAIVKYLKFGTITGLSGMVNDGRDLCDWTDVVTGVTGCR
ncbi:MAG: hypothetical protein L0Y62_01080, partial [Nitrospirae bacterium]|nr:hypothetical protein [Nitrospirota bacterium]